LSCIVTVSIQQAIDNSKSFPAKDVIINIKNGVYYEKVRVYEWNTRIRFIGESKDSTIITYDDYFAKINRGRNSTFHTYTVLVEGDDFYATNLTIENSSGDVGQAVALSVIADRVQINNCRILGNQDTIYASGLNRQHFSDCYIEGTTDFIFGGATALFENCRIHSKKNSYITAASTPQNSAYGFVFLNCQLTSGEGVDQVYLGRPWRDFAKTVFINCPLGDHILPAGWHNWNKPNAEKTAFYAEYGNTGPGFDPKSRASWSYQLKKSQAKKYTRGNILGTNNWYLK
jgi:pectinesterase